MNLASIGSYTDAGTTHSPKNITRHWLAVEGLRDERTLLPEPLSSKATPDEIGHFDEEGAAIAAKARFELASERTVSIARQVIVVPDVERGAGVGSPSQQELSAHV